MVVSQRSPSNGIRRRSLLLSATAALAPLGALADGVCTPRDLARRYQAVVDRQLRVPAHELLICAGLAENELAGSRENLLGPQYMLVVDACPAVQAAFLVWRLLPGRYELIGASPASTGNPEQAGCLRTPQGVFAQAQVEYEDRRLISRVYDFGRQRTRTGRGFADLRLQARAATGRTGALLGRPQSDGCILLPPGLVAFLDQFGVLDAGHKAGVTPGGEALPFAGRYLVVVDSERDERPDWAIA
ncbi:MAG TPA: hypothetical protein VFM98_11860 [Ramlibacter sp.]|uniref:hypothetical protein n=1 Tax=Ramlibacter sp. TaxID=1917967 RepID=UPI002D80017F|nr:hypothetical protein [Ramlibacter sp.]HET8746293.1 hypothetical protein [Ramlibacter sp.]